MRKRIIGTHNTQPGRTSDEGWLDLEQIATVEVTSQDPSFPVEFVFGPKDTPGWRASQPGEQRIRIIFDEPISLHRIALRFYEPDRDRTQEIALRWSSASNGSATEIVRQQWNFSPAGSTTQIEEYAVNLEVVSVLELTIDPDQGRGEAFATLAFWRLR